jgi:hypothetical protein
MRACYARAGLRAGYACPSRWSAYVKTVSKNVLPLHTQGGSRMPELGQYGSVRGALSNERPYRDLRNVVANYPFERSHRFAGIQPKLATETIRV